MPHLKLRRIRLSLLLLPLMLAGQTLPAAELAKPDELSDAQQTAVSVVDEHAQQLKDVNQAIWKLAEVGLQEHQSSALLIENLADAGFKIKTGLAGMPTAFVASYGEGKPVIGILAEYDALPGMSQKVSPRREVFKEGAAGHACGHSGLGTGALGAALAVKEAMIKHKLPGTIRLYGTPAEETVIGKVYMVRDGVFDDLDICLHWHPGTKNQSKAGSSKALVSAKFTFSGTAAHASVSPESGRSALDAVELMNVGCNFMREHLKEDARMHYVIVDGGGAPNVVPAKATVWYFCRADDHRDVEYNFRWLQDIAKGAALMTRTKLDIQIDTDCHEIIPNMPLAQVIHKNLEAIGAPTFTAEEEAFAREMQRPLEAEFGTKFDKAIDSSIHRIEGPNDNVGKGSTDVGDISWRVPTGGLGTACMMAGSPGHSWQNVAAIGSSIGEKGILYAAKTLAATAIDLMEKPELIQAARGDFTEKMEDREYFSFIPKGQKVPEKIR